MNKPQFIEAHQHILQCKRNGQWLDVASIRTEQEMNESTNLVDASNSDAYRIIDKPGMWNSEVVYIRSTVTVAKTPDGTLITTIDPPPIAHVALVKHGGLYRCLMVNAGQVTDLFYDHQMALVQGFQFGFARAKNMPKADRVIIHLPSELPAVEAYARWFVTS